MSKKKNSPIATGIALAMMAGAVALFGGGNESETPKATPAATRAAYVEELSVKDTATDQTTAEATEAAEPTPTVTPKPIMVYISSAKSEVYHRKATCSGMKNPQEIKKEEAEKQGKRPCKRCY